MAFDCTKCGACCAYSEYWPAFNPRIPGDGAHVPPALRHSDGRRMLCIGNRCSALQGIIGVSVQCGVYHGRPNACRNFAAGGAACRMVREALMVDLPAERQPWRRSG